MTNNEKSPEKQRPAPDPRTLRRGYKFAVVYYNPDLGPVAEMLGMVTFYALNLDAAIKWCKEHAPHNATRATTWATERMGPPDPSGLIDVQEALIMIQHPEPNGNATDQSA